jgi:hypothetical protein
MAQNSITKRQTRVGPNTNPWGTGERYVIKFVNGILTIFDRLEYKNCEPDLFTMKNASKILNGEPGRKPRGTWEHGPDKTSKNPPVLRPVAAK